MNAAELIEQARAAGATVLEAGGAVVVVFAATARDGGDVLVPIERAAAIAATSVRVVREAIRAGELEAFGRQRDRSVRREDLARWIESRRAPVVRLADNHEARIERRIARRKKAAR